MLIDAFFYFWNLLGHHKSAYASATVSAVTFGLLKLLNSIYSIIVISMIYTYRMKPTTIFWFILLVQVCLSLMQIIIYKGQMMVLRKELWFYRYLIRKHWQSTICRIYDNSSYEWLMRSGNLSPLMNYITLLHTSMYRMIQLCPRLAITCIFTIASSILTFRVSVPLAIVSILMQVLVVAYVRVSNTLSAELVLQMRKASRELYTCNSNIFGTMFDTVINSNPSTGRDGILRYLDRHAREMATLFSRKQMIDRRPVIELGAVFFLIHCLLVIMFLFMALNDFEHFISIFLWIRSMFASYDYLLNDMLSTFVEMRIFEIDFSNMQQFFIATAKVRDTYKQFTPGDKFQIEMLPFTYTYADNSSFQLKLTRELLFCEGDVVLFDGCSGSGKTTLLKIFRSIHQVDITLNYRDNTKQFNKWRHFPSGWNNLSESICFCQQSGTTFVDSDIHHIVSGTFMGDDEYDTKLVERALSLANVPQELWSRKSITQDTISGGERQRISIARNIYRLLSNMEGKRIVILDEIDANLNEDTALEVFNQILQLCKKQLVFIVAHSPAIKNLAQITKCITVNAGHIAQ